MDYELLKRDGKELYVKDIKLLDREKLKNLSPETVDLLLEMVGKEVYPKELAERLDIHEQKVYYHIGKLKDLGLIETVREERKGGATCKYYTASSESFGFTLNDRWSKVSYESGNYSKKLLSFIDEFVKDNVFNGSIVVGSPRQHGPFLTSSRDGHYAVQLGIFLGNFCELDERFVVKLDTEVKAEESTNRNLILVGGPITNIISQRINDQLEVKFDWEKNWKIISEMTGNEYNSENLGLIAKIELEGNTRILLSGLDFEGTKTSIIALTQYYEKILSDYEQGEDFYRVVKGLDMDGDGKTDAIEVLE